MKWKDNLPLLLGGVSTLFIGVRILSIARFDPQTAYGILQAGGAAAVIIGAILSLIGLIALAVSAYCLHNVIHPAGHQSELQKNIFLFLGVVFGLISFFTAPAALSMVPTVILVAGIAITGRIQMARSRKRVAEVMQRNDPEEMGQAIRELQEKIDRGKKEIKTDGRILVVVLAMMCTYYATNTSPWYPPQELTVAHQRPMTVYVLSENDTEMAVLTAKTRQLEYYGVPDIIEHRICRQPGISWATDPLPQLITSFQPKYITCPSN